MSLNNQTSNNADLNSAEQLVKHCMSNDDPLAPFARTLIYVGIAYAKGDLQAAEEAVRLFVRRRPILELEAEIAGYGIKEGSVWRHERSRETYKVIGLGFLEEFHDIRVAYRPISYFGPIFFRRPDIFLKKFAEVNI